MAPAGMEGGYVGATQVRAELEVRAEIEINHLRIQRICRRCASLSVLC